MIYTKSVYIITTYFIYAMSTFPLYFHFHFIHFGMGGHIRCTTLSTLTTLITISMLIKIVFAGIGIFYGNCVSLKGVVPLWHHPFSPPKMEDLEYYSYLHWGVLGSNPMGRLNVILKMLY